jgi:HicB family
LRGLVDVVADTVADLVSEGRAVPEPLSERSYSGKFNLRVGEGLHRRLAIQAAEEHLSLNQFVVRRLPGASQATSWSSRGRSDDPRLPHIRCTLGRLVELSRHRP